MDAALIAHEAAPKAAWYAALVMAIGLVVVRALVGRAGELNGELATLARREVARLALWAAGAAWASLVLRLLGHTVVAFGPHEAFTADALRTIGLDSRWGQGWQVQLAATVALAAAAPALGSAAGALWGLAALAALGCVASVPMLGHGAESLGQTVLHGAHVLGAGAWLGTLIAILLLEHRMRRAYGVTAAGALAAALVPRFSPVAVFAASLAGVTGAIALLEYVPSPAALIGTGYGRALLVKLLLVGVIGACGFVNWQAVLAGRPPRRGVMLLEAMAALAVVAASAVLTESEPP